VNTFLADSKIGALIHCPSHVDLAPITSLVEFIAITSSPLYGQEAKIVLRSQGIRRDDNEFSRRTNTIAISLNTNPYYYCE
jgi:hypothetical protein